MRHLSYSIRPFYLMVAIVAVMGSACSPLYTPPVAWTYDDPKTEDDFRPDVTACVTQADPAHLYELDNDGEYSVTGLFVDTSRTQGVVSCMEAKGWDVDGPGWYQGPVR